MGGAPVCGHPAWLWCESHTNKEPAEGSSVASVQRTVWGYESSMMEHPGFSECFPVIQSVRAVKAQVKKARVPLGWPRNLCGGGGRPEIDIPEPERLARPAWTNVLTAAPGPRLPPPPPVPQSHRGLHRYRELRARRSLEGGAGDGSPQRMSPAEDVLQRLQGMKRRRPLR